MKAFEISSRTGINFVVGINEKPYVKETYNGYEKKLQITSLVVDGVEVPRNKRGNLFMVKFEKRFHEGENKLFIRIDYAAFEFIKELKGIKTRETFAMLLCSDELVDYYNNVYLPAADKIVEHLKAEKAAKIQAAFDSLKDDTMLKISQHTTYGYSVSHGAGDHEYFEKVFKEAKKARVEFPNKYITDTDWGDYSITTYYLVPFGEVKKLYQAAREILEPKERKAAERKAARDAKHAALKDAAKCEILKQGKSRGEGLDPYAIVRMTDRKTGEQLEFTCRNIFDVGYVINPNYAVAEGLEPGGLCIEGKWKTFEDEKGWYYVRELTEFEKLCLEYLDTFPPVTDKIRM